MQDWGRRYGTLVAVFCTAVGVRLAYAWVFQPWVAAKADFSATSGSDGYEHIADCLLQGAGYRFRPDLGETLFRLPGYPMFLCALWWLFGPNLWIVQIVQALLSGGTSLLIFRVGKRYFSPTVGLLAGLGFAFWPVDWIVSARYSVEPLYVFMLVLAIVLVLDLAQRPRFGLAAMSGLIFGCASLVREVNLFLPLFLAAAIPLSPLSRGKRLRCFLAMIVAVLVVGAVIVPWAARGYRLTGTIVLPTTGGGFNLYATTSFSRQSDSPGNPRDITAKAVAPDLLAVLASHGIRENSQDYYSTYWWTFMSVEDEFRADQILRRTAIEEIRSDPVRFFRTVLGNAIGFWFRGASAKMTWMARGLFVPLLLLGAVGFMVAARARENVAWVLLLVIAYFNLACAPSIAFVRYTLPATPALLLLAARGMACLFPSGQKSIGLAAAGRLWAMCKGLHTGP